MNVFIIAALTADGFIAEHSDHPADWTSREDKQLFVDLTKQAGVMVMGSRTFATIGRALPDRQTIVYTNHPESITVPGVQTTDLPPKQLLDQIQGTSANAVAICGGSSIYRQFLGADVVDELFLTIEPVLFGQGVTLVDQALEIKLSLMESRPLNQSTVLLHYKIIK
ncbi:MAG: dihydrofolate reductase [Candidatus Saccharimonadales bacterium]